MIEVMLLIVDNVKKMDVGSQEVVGCLVFFFLREHR